MGWSRLCRSSLGSILALLFALSSLQLCLFQEPAFFCQSTTFFPVLDLILPDQCVRWLTKDTLVFTELANPNVIRGWRMLKVVVLLLKLSLSSCKGVNIPSPPSRFLSLSTITGCLTWCTRSVLSTLGRNIRTCLSGLRRVLLLSTRLCGVSKIVGSLRIPGRVKTLFRKGYSLCFSLTSKCEL